MDVFSAEVLVAVFESTRKVRNLQALACVCQRWHVLIGPTLEWAKKRSERVVVRAVFSFDSKRERELSFEAGEEILVFNVVDRVQWGFGQTRSKKIGYFPLHLVQVKSKAIRPGSSLYIIGTPMCVVWKRLKRCLPPTVLAALEPAATIEQIKQAEDHLGLKLPEELTKFLLVHNGQRIVDNTSVCIDLQMHV